MRTLSASVDAWLAWIVPVSWQIALLVILIAAIAFLGRRLSARFRCLLWTLVLLKVIVSPFLPTPGSLGPWLAPPAELAAWTAPPDSPLPPTEDDDAASSAVARAADPPNVRSLPAGIQPASIARAPLPTRSAAIDPPVVVATPFSFTHKLFLVWIVGVASFLLTVALHYVHTLTLVRHGTGIDEGPLRIALERLAHGLGRTNPPDMIVADRIASPFLIGLFRPRIVLPTDLVERLKPQEVEDVLLHELIHWKRRDLWVAWLQIPVQAAFWFHPFVWWTAAQLQLERECACDESVLAAGRRPAADYAESLLRVLLAARGRSPFTTGFLGIFERNTRLQKRLGEILYQESKLRTFGPALWVLLALVAAIPMPMAAQSAETTPTASVRVVVGVGAMTYEGQPVTLDQLPTLLETVPDRPRTVLEFAVATDDLTLNQVRPIHNRLLNWSRELGFAYLSDVGVHPLGSTPNEAPVLPPTGSSDLQARVDAAEPGSIIDVPPGTHAGPLLIAKPLTLRGLDPESTVIELLADEPAILIRDTQGVALENLTVRWSNKLTDARIENPAAIAVRDADAVIRNCRLLPIDRPMQTPNGLLVTGRANVTFTGGRAEGFAYALLYTGGAGGTVNDSILKDADHSEVTLHEHSEVRIERNILGGCNYHAVRNTGGAMEMTDNIVYGCKRAGAYLGNKDAHGRIENNLFIENDGGIWGYYGSDVTIERNLFLENKDVAVSFWVSCALVVRDNIFMRSPHGVIRYQAGTPGSTLDGNLYWNLETDTKDIERESNALAVDPGLDEMNRGVFTPTNTAAMEKGLVRPKTIEQLFEVYAKFVYPPSESESATPVDVLESESIGEQIAGEWRATFEGDEVRLTLEADGRAIVKEDDEEHTGRWWKNGDTIRYEISEAKGMLRSESADLLVVEKDDKVTSRSLAFHRVTSPTASSH
jgi:beta-lactamase regulating signal transducer with metallopeptidase domain/nitrous oxidase accessory protein NosD